MVAGRLTGDVSAFVTRLIADVAAGGRALDTLRLSLTERHEAQDWRGQTSYLLSYAASYSTRRLAIARPSVTSSAYSRSPPTGRP